MLFSPERQPNAVAAAGAFAVVLLPYSLVGPLAGSLLDRFSRQRVVKYSYFIRALLLLLVALMVKIGYSGVGLTLTVLGAFGLNRLILAGLSAGLPLIVSRRQLISANALAVTGGTIGVVIGGGIGIALKKILDARVNSDVGVAALLVLAALGYLASALITNRLTRYEIGPVEHEHISQNVGWRELRDAYLELNSHGDSLRAIWATSIQRGGLTAATLMALLLERNTFNPSSKPDLGLAGFATALGIAGIGIGVGALVSPVLVTKTGRHKLIRIMMLVGIPGLILFAFIQNEIMMIVAAFLIGLGGQSVKVTTDALVQNKISDEFRGRAFAFYDVTVNSSIVIGAIMAALVLPNSGKSFVLPFVISSIYVLATLWLLRKNKFIAGQ